MKKIIGAALATTMLAGSAFAADISFSYTGYNYFKSSGGNLALDERSDCMGLTISTETCGAVLDFDTDSDAKTLKHDSYYGWMTFPVPTGNLQITAGSWNARYLARVNTDAGDLDGDDFEKYKPGVIGGLVGYDSDNLTKGAISMVAAYTNSDMLPGALLAKFGLVKSSYNPDATAATTAKESGDVTDGDLSLSAGFVGELAYRQEKVINVNLAIKNLQKKNLSLGLFVSPLMVENLELTTGFTFGLVNDYDKSYSADGTTAEWGDGATEFGFDIRARYQVSDALAVTTMHNISSHANKGTADKANEYGDNTLRVWDMLNVAYKFAEDMTIGCTLNAVFDDLDSDHVFTGADLTTSPYLAIKATEKVSVTTSVRFDAKGLNPRIDGHESLDVTVPVIFSFNY